MATKVLSHKYNKQSKQHIIKLNVNGIKLSLAVNKNKALTNSQVLQEVESRRSVLEQLVRDKRILKDRIKDIETKIIEVEEALNEVKVGNRD